MLKENCCLFMCLFQRIQELEERLVQKENQLLKTREELLEYQHKAVSRQKSIFTVKRSAGYRVHDVGVSSESSTIGGADIKDGKISSKYDSLKTSIGMKYGDVSKICLNGVQPKVFPTPEQLRPQQDDDGMYNSKRSRKLYNVNSLEYLENIDN